MELHRLRYFVAVAELGSFTRAAAREGVTQPSLSQQILELEKELDTSLFDRLGRKVVLTAADGNRFAAFAASPDGPAATGVVVLPDIRGLYRFYEEVALRLAERGYAAVAFDYFGRTAGAEKRTARWQRGSR